MDAWRGVVRVKSALGGGTIRVGVGVQTATVRADNPDAFDVNTITWGTTGTAENALSATITSATASVMWCRPVLAAYLTSGTTATTCTVEVEIDYVNGAELLASPTLQLSARTAVDFAVITGFIPLAWVGKVKAGLILANAPGTARLWLAHQLASTNTGGTNANGGPGTFTTSFSQNPGTWPIVSVSETCTGELTLSVASTDTWVRFALAWQLTSGSPEEDTYGT